MAEEMAVFLAENEQRQEKWSSLTEGIKSDYDRKVTEVLFENTQKFFEQQYKRPLDTLMELSTTGNVDPFTTYAFPLIRRVFPGLIANQLVSIQPIPQPTAKIFYLDFSYGADIAPTQKGDRFDREAPGGNGAEFSKFNPYYASSMARGETAGVGDGANTQFYFGLGQPVFDESVVVYVDAVGTTAYTLDADKKGFNMNAAPANGATITVDYTANTEGQDYVPEIDFNITDSDIGTESKKLKARWTIESQQDLMAYHGLDAEVELTGMLGDEIGREIDRMIVNDLLTHASAGNVNWLASKPVGFDGSLKEYNETLFHAILDASTLIFKKRLREANFIVAGVDFCSRMEKINSFRYAAGVEGGTMVTGMHVFGTLSNKFNIIKDPMMPNNKALVGYKGSSWMETGYVYAPYVPLFTTPTFMHPKDFTPTRGVMSRFGRKTVVGDYYATVTIN